jgi:sarcosine oxidase subunit beta
VVNCAGAWGDQIAGWLGEAVPLRAGGLMMIVTARVPPFNDPVVGLTSRALSFKQTAAGTVLIGGTLHTGADRDRETTRLDFARVAKSGRTVSDVFPHLRGVPVMRCWAGIEGFTPDDIPVIGPSRTAPGIFHAFGYCGHGFELGPAVGGVIAELVTQGKTNIPIAPFAIDRFADGV